MKSQFFFVILLSVFFENTFLFASIEKLNCEDTLQIKRHLVQNGFAVFNRDLDLPQSYLDYLLEAHYLSVEANYSNDYPFMGSHYTQERYNDYLYVEKTGSRINVEPLKALSISILNTLNRALGPKEKYEIENAVVRIKLSGDSFGSFLHQDGTQFTALSTLLGSPTRVGDQENIESIPVDSSLIITGKSHLIRPDMATWHAAPNLAEKRIILLLIFKSIKEAK